VNRELLRLIQLLVERKVSTEDTLGQDLSVPMLREENERAKGLFGAGVTDWLFYSDIRGLKRALSSKGIQALEQETQKKLAPVHGKSVYRLTDNKESQIAIKRFGFTDDDRRGAGFAWWKPSSLTYTPRGKEFSSWAKSGADLVSNDAVWPAAVPVLMEARTDSSFILDMERVFRVFPDFNEDWTLGELVEEEKEVIAVGPVKLVSIAYRLPWNTPGSLLGELVSLIRKLPDPKHMKRVRELTTELRSWRHRDATALGKRIAESVDQELAGSASKEVWRNFEYEALSTIPGLSGGEDWGSVFDSLQWAMRVRLGS
jgi:hypothetical protein